MTTDQSAGVSVDAAAGNGAAPGPVPDPAGGPAATGPPGPVMSERVMAAIGFLFAIGLAVIAVDLWTGGRLLGGAPDEQQD